MKNTESNKEPERAEGSPEIQIANLFVPMNKIKGLSVFESFLDITLEGGTVVGLTFRSRHTARNTLGWALRELGKHGFDFQNHKSSGRERYATFLRSREWLEIRAKKLTESPACEACGSRDSLQCHHVRYPSRWEDTQLTDLQVLCQDCHDDVHDARDLKKVLAALHN